MEKIWLVACFLWNELISFNTIPEVELLENLPIEKNEQYYILMEWVDSYHDNGEDKIRWEKEFMNSIKNSTMSKNYKLLANTIYTM